MLWTLITERENPLSISATTNWVADTQNFYSLTANERKRNQKMPYRSTGGHFLIYVNYRKRTIKTMGKTTGQRSSRQEAVRGKNQQAAAL